MTIEKKGKIYTIRENAKSWTVSVKIAINEVERVTINANVSKADCPTFDSLKAFVAENDIF